VDKNMTKTSGIKQKVTGVGGFTYDRGTEQAKI